MRNRAYDIFSGTPGDEPLWLEAVEGLGAAITRMKEIARNLPGRYFVFDCEERAVLTSINTSAANGGLAGEQIFAGEDTGDDRV